jgi:demethylmenaquinone methyltransferase/2-methoxy-6-polyprenyl-1,4-benzoquinol methylase
VNFGHRVVSEDEHVESVNKVFTDVASNYDVMNDVMSFGIHRIWKDWFVEDIGSSDVGRFSVLDVAGGTGDITFRIKEKHPLADITVFDLTADMLEEGKQRNRYSGIKWVQGNAEELPFPDNSFDLYTISFGIRNVTNRNKALREAYRVLKHGGRFMCLEFSKVTNPLFASIYEAYSFSVIPFFGEVIANSRDSYQYLVESIEKFPTQEEFAFNIKKAGFEMVSHKDLSGGICAIHSGLKLDKSAIN